MSSTSSFVMASTYRGDMCRNITELRGLEPAATAEEIEAAARQYVRKVSGITRPSGANVEAFEAAVVEVTATTTRLLAEPPAAASATQDRSAAAAAGSAGTAQCRPRSPRLAG